MRLRGNRPGQPSFVAMTVGKQELAHTEIEKDLRAEPVVPQIGRESQLRICLHRIETFFLAAKPIPRPS
jgi:hypothetical protein